MLERNYNKAYFFEALKFRRIVKDSTAIGRKTAIGNYCMGSNNFISTIFIKLQISK